MRAADRNGGCEDRRGPPRQGRRRLAIKLKRVYEPPAPADGVRVLVDRLWPRGLRKEAAAVDHWARDIAPSAELRRWFGHDPERWPEFRARYRQELLAGRPDALAALRRLCAEGPVTLVYAARDEQRNNAVVLRELLEEESSPQEA
jgi:uncharacterized protein YeaO (DUF488 family)